MPSSIASRYSIVEPHPTAIPSKSYIHSGRGGAGNVTKAPANVTTGANATGPAARASVISMSKPRTSFASGRGGAGNIHIGSERAIFSFDEELERQMSRENALAPVYHVGRGGAGNVNANKQQQASLAARRSSRSSADSTSSAESGADIATRKFKEGLRRMTNRS